MVVLDSVVVVDVGSVTIGVVVEAVLSVLTVVLHSSG